MHLPEPAKKIIVIGSVNVDIVAHSSALPKAGETVIGATIARYPGGKGANQALAAKRLGAEVSLVARVGDDGFAKEALALLESADVDLTQCQICPNSATGTALIVVDEAGANQIVVGSGANAALIPEQLPQLHCDAVIAQLEVPIGTVLSAAQQCNTFFSLNAAPATALPPELLTQTDLLVVNELEADMLSQSLENFEGLLAVSYGAQGAKLFQKQLELASSASPNVNVVDTTGCGDAFTAALTLSLVQGILPQQALDYACDVGALTATKAGAQPSFPSTTDLANFKQASQD